MYHLINEEFHGSTISFRQEDAWVNLTQMCAVFAKKPYSFLRIAPTQDYIKALAADLGLQPPNDAANPDFNCVGETQLKGLIETREGRHDSGTWAHPELAIECARWLSPEWSIRCNRVIRRLLAGETVKGTRPTMAQSRLSKQRLKMRSAELRAELDGLRRQYAALLEAEVLPGHVPVTHWLLEHQHTLTPGESSRLGSRLSAAAMRGEITCGQQTIAVPPPTRAQRVKTYTPEAIAEEFKALFPPLLAV